MARSLRDAALRDPEALLQDLGPADGTYRSIGYDVAGGLFGSLGVLHVREDGIIESMYVRQL